MKIWREGEIDVGLTRGKRRKWVFRVYVGSDIRCWEAQSAIVKSTK
jgi:hypothetical protein